MLCPHSHVAKNAKEPSANTWLFLDLSPPLIPKRDPFLCYFFLAIIRRSDSIPARPIPRSIKVAPPSGTPLGVVGIVSTINFAASAQKSPLVLEIVYLSFPVFVQRQERVTCYYTAADERKSDLNRIKKGVISEVHGNPFLSIRQ